MKCTKCGHTPLHIQEQIADSKDQTHVDMVSIIALFMSIISLIGLFLIWYSA